MVNVDKLDLETLLELADEIVKDSEQEWAKEKTLRKCWIDAVARHVTQILHNEEVGPAEVELLMSKLKQILDKKMKVRAFISLVQTIEDRADPRSKYHDKTVDQILEQFRCEWKIIIRILFVNSYYNFPLTPE